MADALGSGPSGRKVVKVQLLSSALVFFRGKRMPLISDLWALCRIEVDSIVTLNVRPAPESSSTLRA